MIGTKNISTNAATNRLTMETMNLFMTGWYREVQETSRFCTTISQDRQSVITDYTYTNTDSHKT